MSYVLLAFGYVLLAIGSSIALGYSGCRYRMVTYVILSLRIGQCVIRSIGWGKACRVTRKNSYKG